MARKYYTSRGFTIAAAAQAAGTGHLFCTVPSGAAVRPRLSKVRWCSQLNSTLLTNVATRIQLIRITFASGSPGGLGAGCAGDTALAAAIFEIGNAIGTLAGIAEVTPFAGFLCVANQTAVGQGDEGGGPVWEGDMVFSPLQGFLARQITAGVAADTRLGNLDFEWTE